jgi:hypothetical protein
VGGDEFPGFVSEDESDGVERMEKAAGDWLAAGKGMQTRDLGSGITMIVEEGDPNGSTVIQGEYSEDAMVPVGFISPTMVLLFLIRDADLIT